MNIVVTSTPFTVNVAFNSYASKLALNKVSFRRNGISKISDVNDSIIVYMSDSVSYRLSVNAQDYSMIVDTIDGVVPTSNADLYNKLIALQQV